MNVLDEARFVARQAERGSLQRRLVQAGARVFCRECGEYRDWGALTAMIAAGVVERSCPECLTVLHRSYVR